MKKKIYVTSIAAALLLTNLSVTSSTINIKSRIVYAEEVNDANISAGLAFLQNFINNNSFTTIATQINNPPFSTAMGLLSSLNSGPIFTCSADNVLRVNDSAVTSIVANFSVKYPNTHLTAGQVSGIFSSIANAFNRQSSAKKESTKNLISGYCTYEQPATTPADSKTPADSADSTDTSKSTDPGSSTNSTTSADSTSKQTDQTQSTDSTGAPSNTTTPAKSVTTTVDPAKSTDSNAAATDINTAAESQDDSNKKTDQTTATKNLTFTDVDKNSWAKDAISYLSSKNIIKGIDKQETKFNPKGNVTRAEFVTIIVRALNLQNVEYTGGFKDVENGEWYADFVASASKYGIVQGDASQSFNPNKTITKEEIAKIIVIAYELKTGKSTQELLGLYKDGAIKDVSKASKWASDYIKIANSLGIINGNNSGEYMPKGNATREEVAKMVYNLITNVAIS